MSILQLRTGHYDYAKSCPRMYFIVSTENLLLLIGVTKYS